MKVKRCGEHDLPLPHRATLDSAGYDLMAVAPVDLYPGDRVAIPCGFAVALPMGMVGLIWPRSGMAVRQGVDTLAGVIDSDYTGEVKAVLINHGMDRVQIRAGDRIAQLVIVPCLQAPTVEVDELETTERGCGGFGSTG